MTTLSAADKARQDAARENDGKFGAQLHGEPAGGTGILTAAPVYTTASASEAVVTIPSSRVKLHSHGIELPDWPEGYPEPQVSWELDGGVPKTRVVIGEPGEGEIWTLETDHDNGGVNRSVQNYGLFGDDYEATAKASDWAGAVHERIDTAVYSITHEATGSNDINAKVLEFATTDNHDAPKAESPALDPGFINVVRELQVEADRSRKRLQHAYMIQAFTEIPKSVASFYLRMDDDRLTTGDALDADGNPVSASHAQALSEAFRYRHEDDYSSFIDQTINVSETLDAWQ